MTDDLATLDHLRRPRLLIQAAREGCAEYNREPHLRRLFGARPVPVPGRALGPLIEIEDRLNQQRRTGENGYCLMRHIDVLIAMMSEAQLARQALIAQ